jgi:hypothetical protein
MGHMISETAAKVSVWLMFPQYAVPFYLALIWLTPGEYRYYWGGIWFGGIVGLHLINPVGGTGYQGADQEPKNDIQYLALILRDSLMFMLPIAGVIFAVLLKVFS